jgi:hypothetical protein
LSEVRRSHSKERAVTYALQIAREVAAEALGLDPELAASEVYEVEKLAKAVIERCAQVIKDARGECNDNELMRRIRALAEER